MDLEREVARHYTHGALADAIRRALIASGKDPDNLAPADLAPVDQFHIGGAEATAALFAQARPAAGSRWLDIGSGLGGPARHLAVAHGCTVVGIDLTEEYVAVATDLAARVGLADKVSFRAANAAALPFEDASFDGAALLHVGMNIPDKAALFAGARRVLRPGGTFAVYDIMRVGEGDLAYPVPWATDAAASFVETPASYRAALEGAGFAIAAERDRVGFALDFFRALRARMAQGGAGALGLHILMGETAAQKSANMVANIERGLIAPTEIIARAV
ncbi:MAG: methyltransferase domain-containing protein [Proteobacteria bacterium]|nr:methyltransferase domain-containing protein [Pseudomonadota bacterium]